MPRTKSRQLAAIMFTDIVGYTALMQENEAIAIEKRSKHRAVFEKCHKQFNGDILQYYGDGTLSIFKSGVEAVECAIKIQNELSGSEGVPLRIGIHTGDIVSDGTEVFGDGVNVAARIESISSSGSILISGRLNEELQNQNQINTSSLGLFEFKNVTKPVEVFAVTNPGIQQPDTTALKSKRKSPEYNVAVLPLANRSADASTDYFADGMTEEIINALAKIKRLKVTSRTSSFHYKGKNLPLRQIGEELNVSIILDGSIRLVGQRMRLSAQLIDVAEDYQFWSETFDRTVDDIFAVQDEISLLVADKLREHTGHFDIDDQLVSPTQVSIDVYQQYLKGRYHILKMSSSEVEKGLSLIREVIELQPDYVYGQLGMHFGYTMIASLGLAPAHEAFAQGLPYLQKALELDPDLPECQLQLSYMTLLQDWDLQTTYEHLSKVFEVRPNVEYYQSMASTLAAECKIRAAGEYIDTALQLDPYSPINYHLRGYIYYINGEYDQAIPWFEKSQKLRANFMVSVIYLGQALLLSGRKSEALDYFESLTGDHAGDLTQLGGTTLAHVMMDDLDLAQSGIAALEAALQSDKMDKALEILLMIYAQMGEHDKALGLVVTGIKTRLPMMIYIKHEPMLRPLWINAEFEKLMSQVFGNTATAATKERRYKKSLFSKEQLGQLRNRLESFMAEKKVYLDAQLSLRGLAEQMELSPNELSQLLNEGLDMNFSEFVNSYRLEEFKTKVADEKLQNLTLLALAYDSGFNSKTVFNSFFKKMMKMTPKAYLKSVRS